MPLVPGCFAGNPRPLSQLQIDLARLVPNVVSRDMLLCGPRLVTLQQLAKGFRISISDIFKGVQQAHYNIHMPNKSDEEMRNSIKKYEESLPESERNSNVEEDTKRLVERASRPFPAKPEKQ